jgi:hypothetical protein
MNIMFKCQNCKQLKVFSNKKTVEGKDYCEFCAKMLKDYKKEKDGIKQKREEQKVIKAKLKAVRKEETANKQLQEQLAKEKEIQKLREEKALAKKAQKQAQEEAAPAPGSIMPKEKKVVPTPEKEAEKLSELYDTVLYVFATVKLIQVIEWREGKKKVLLNKEREVRRTHKGGWSQNKFQRFVDFKKKQSIHWIESNIVKTGVLRPPYQKLVISSDNPKIKEGLVKIIEKVNKT